MLTQQELTALITRLPEISGVEVIVNREGRYVGCADYPPIPLRYPDGSYYEIADDDCGEDGATPEEALVRLLVSCCLEWGRLPDGKEGWLFDNVVRYDGEAVECPGCKGVATLYKTRMDLRIVVPRRIAHDGKRRVEVLKFEDGSELICPTCGEVEGEPPQYFEERQAVDAGR